MKRVFIIHRWEGGSQDDWRPWLKVELKKLGFEVYTPDMEDTEVPVIDTWVNQLSNLVGIPDENTYFIGHSIGCQAILRYLEKIDVVVGGAVFVAGWFNLENLEDKEVKEIAAPWINTTIDILKVKQVLPKSTLFISDNDPYRAFEENKNKFSKLGSKIVVLHNAGHITAEDGFNALPQVIDEVLTIM